MSRSPDLIEPGWDAVLLVCKDCKRRSKGPRGLKSKEVASALKHASKGARPRPRVVAVSCLGVCPHGAMAVAAVGGGRAARVACIASLADVSSDALALLGAAA